MPAATKRSPPTPYSLNSLSETPGRIWSGTWSSGWQSIWETRSALGCRQFRGLEQVRTETGFHSVPGDGAFQISPSSPTHSFLGSRKVRVQKKRGFLQSPTTHMECPHGSNSLCDKSQTGGDRVRTTKNSRIRAALSFATRATWPRAMPWSSLLQSPY